MKLPHISRRVAVAPLAFVLALAVVLAQQPKVSTPPAAPTNIAQESSTASSVTIDTMFAADSYAIYGEMRMVGQYVSSADFKQLFEPLRQPGTMPPELTELLDFITAHAEALSSSRVAFGAMPIADGLPDVIAAVELSSAEDAAKLEPQLRRFLNAYYAAHPDAVGTTPDTEQPGATRATATLGTTTTSPEGTTTRAARRRATLQSASSPTTVRANEKVAPEAAAPVFIRRAGSLLVMADKQFTFRKLRGAAGGAMLADEPGFQAARSRLATDTLFLYFNTKRMSRYTKRQMDEYERQRKQMEAEAEQARASGEGYNKTITSRGSGTTSITVVNSNMNSVEAASANSNVSVAVGSSNSNSNSAPASEAIIDTRAPISPTSRIRTEDQSDAEPTPEKVDEATQRERERQQEFENQLGRVIFSGDTADGAWAESIGVGASLEGDQVVVRALFYSDSDSLAPRPIPFIPILLSGPPIAPEASTVLPADTDIYVSASLDLPQMYDYVASVFKLFEMAASATGEQDKQGLFESQVSAFEKENKFRIKEDLLATLGNEIAVCLPSDFLGVRRPRKVAKSEAGSATGNEPAKAETETRGASPVVVISLTDKKALEELLPRALEAVGVKGVSEQQLIEKHGDVDLLTFTNGSAAIIGRFLVVSPDAATMRWIVDAYNRGETLANNEAFRNAAGWQERQVLGQIYVSNALLKDMFTDVNKSVEDIDDPALRVYLTRLDPNPGAVTHSLTKDGGSLFHELHIPKNLLSLWGASAIISEKLAPQRRNESMATFAAYNVARMESEYKDANGRYGTLAELEAQLKKANAEESNEQEMTLSFLKVEGYQIKLTASGDKFELTVTPTGYPKQGRRSFYVDQTGVMRGGDLGGKQASAESETIND
jgi:hypothetical protein